MDIECTGFSFHFTLKAHVFLDTVLAVVVLLNWHNLRHRTGDTYRNKRKDRESAKARKSEKNKSTS